MISDVICLFIKLGLELNPLLDHRKICLCKVLDECVDVCSGVLEPVCVRV